MNQKGSKNILVTMLSLIVLLADATSCFAYSTCTDGGYCLWKT